jgi:hypothetical protein
VDKDLKTSLKVSDFLDSLSNKFYEDHEELKSSQLSLNIVQKNFRLMFEKCLDHTKDRLIYRNVMLPITGDFTINYYLEKIYNCILRFINRNQPLYYFSGSRIDNFNFRRMIYSFNFYLLELQKKAAKNFFKDGHFLKYFFNSSQKIKSLEDIIKIENKMCDYYNMMVYIIKLDLIPINYNSVFCFLNPTFIDDSDFKIVNGLEIELDYLKTLKSIVALIEKENNLTLEENVHYFIDKFSKAYIPNEILKKLNVQELEITFYYKKYGKIFQVIEYFKI